MGHSSTRRKTPIAELGSARARPGEKAWGQLGVRRGKKSVRLAAGVVHGATPGPHAVLLANQHGIELSGFEAIRRVVEELDPATMHGTVFALPSMNPRAAMLGEQCWPEEQHARLLRSFGAGPYKNAKCDYRTRYNLNWQWPGKANGSLADRIVFEIWNRAVMAPHRHAGLLVDLHAFDIQSPTAVFAEDDVAADLGVASGIPYVVKTRFDGHKTIRVGAFTVASSNTACRNAGIPAVTIELSGQGAIFPAAIAQGRVALSNLLKHAGILSGRPVLPAQTYILDPWRDEFTDRKYARPSHMMHCAKKAGLVIPHHRHYDRVKKGDLVCEVANPYTGRIVESGRAGMGGMIYSIHQDGFCGRGDRLFIVSTVRVVSSALERIP